MNNSVKIALIIAAAIIVGVSIFVYFSPYQSCVRGMRAGAPTKPGVAEVYCARGFD